MPVFSFLCVEIYRACWNIIVSLLEIPTVQQRIVSAQRASRTSQGADHAPTKHDPEMRTGDACKRCRGLLAVL
jgi:hypothetical protein